MQQISTKTYKIRYDCVGKGILMELSKKFKFNNTSNSLSEKKKSEMINKYLTSTKNKISIEHMADDYTNCSWCAVLGTVPEDLEYRL